MRRGVDPGHKGALMRFLAPCPACGQHAPQHRFSMIAFASTSEGKSRLTDFLEAVKNFDWARLVTFQNFDPQVDVMEASVVECRPADALLVVISNPVELYDNADVWLWYRIPAEVAPDAPLGSRRWESLNEAD